MICVEEKDLKGISKGITHQERNVQKGYLNMALAVVV